MKHAVTDNELQRVLTSMLEKLTKNDDYNWGDKSPSPIIHYTKV